ncbi:MAG: hypothetical protein R3301_06700 [Saprospiraceae bacterium]|nr:hypothetical protein [Saprospiraceae bacterium]
MTRKRFLWLILAGMVSITTLTAMTASCYTIWLAAFTQATADYNSAVDDCHSDHFVMGLTNGLDLCLWEASYDYGQTIDQAGADYELCLLLRGH